MEMCKKACEINMQNDGYTVKIREILTSKNLIREWPNESSPKYFQLIRQSGKIFANFL